MSVDKNVYKRISIFLFVGIIFLPLPAFPLGPEGHPSSIELELRSELSWAIDRYGSDGSDLNFVRKVKAFIWDNRHHVDVYEIQDHRLIDAAICILKTDYGYSGFKRDDGWSKSFLSWCEHIHR